MHAPLPRREMLQQSARLLAFALAHPAMQAFAQAPAAAGEVALPFADPQAPGRGLRWDELHDWVTPNAQVFSVSHYGTPELNPASWHLECLGLVRRPLKLSLPEIQARRRRTITATLECSGNGSSPGFIGAVANVRWTGTPLGPILKEAGLLPRAREVVFFGADRKTEKIRDQDYPQQFARSLALADAVKNEVLLAYEMNGEPLDRSHGGPVRLVVPGWFGIAWIKWLTRIELHDRRFMSKYMAREYVTIRGEPRDSETIWHETSVGPIAVKSVVARAVRRSDGVIRFSGAAWTDGTPLAKVEFRIDEGPWMPARLRPKRDPYAWTFWDFDWTTPSFGEHQVVSRAVTRDGRVQPSAEDPAIKLKRTYWEANQQWPRRIKV